MSENESILLENAVQPGEIVVGDIAKRYLLDEQEVVSVAERLASQGLLEKVRPDAYCTTELGRTTWNSVRDSILRSEREQVVRRSGLWGRPA
jgi:Mn-dependent DtxR family transcriptional regulator